MVVGSGLIANVFSNYIEDNNVVIFASGVSNSGERSEAEFLRETHLIENHIRQNDKKIFVYFSTCSIDDPELSENLYQMHKDKVEKLIKKQCSRYLIFRLPNIIGSFGNKKNIINFLIDRVSNHIEFDLWINATRNIVDIEDVYKVASYIINNRTFVNKTINIAYNKNVKVFDLVKCIELLTGGHAIFTLIDAGSDIKIDNYEAGMIMRKLHIVQPNIACLLEKYKIAGCGKIKC